jgi:tetratricopeptide (TPR) repeat protein
MTIELGTSERRGRGKGSWAPEVLAALLAVFLASATSSADVTPPSVTIKEGPHSLEITGGEGASAWRLQYGTYAHIRVPHELLVAGDVAYFSHGPWLRQIDTRRGAVIGRWRFPWQIAHLTLDGGKVLVEIAQAEDIAHSFRRTVVLDPLNESKNAQIPNWPLAEPQFSVTEAAGPWSLALSGLHDSIDFHIPAQKARDILPEVDEMVRRDPLSPWLQVTQGVLLRTLDDPRAGAVLRSAAATPGADYSELIRISAFLSQVGEAEGARDAFERGYRDFLDRGFDPRLLTSSWVRRELYPTLPGKGKLPDEDWMDRCYRLAPGARNSRDAWAAYASQLQSQGRLDRAQVWQQRADDPSAFDARMPVRRYEDLAGLCWIMFGVGMAPAEIYMVILISRYRRQGKSDSTGRYSLAWFQYPNRPERMAFLTLVFFVAAAAGLFMILTEGFLRLRNAPPAISSGSLAGPANVAYLEGLPAGKDRDILRAFAYQQSGEDEKAASLYRAIPEFAESWNNLGVLLKKAGKDGEARSAFESALRLDPDLPQASFNLRGTSNDPLTMEYARLFPGRPQLAAPGGEHFRTIWFGGPLGVRALMSPFLIRRSGPLDPPAGMLRGMLVGLSIFVAWVLIVPRRRVSSPPGRVSLIGEIILPGSARPWMWLGGWIGGVAMTAWGLVWLFTLMRRLTVDLLVGTGEITSPSVAVSAYGITPRPGTPLTIPLILGALLFVANLILVLRSRKKASAADV